MLFSSISYFIFFPIVFLLYWSCPKQARRLILLLASYVFYMSWIPAYGLLIALLTAINYVLALAIEKFKTAAKAVFVFGLVINLGTLCFYKYTNFLINSFADLLKAFAPILSPPAASSLSFPELNIILPLGISFFAFEFIHYLSDVYKGDKAIRSPLDFALFAAFFPSQIAGPIKRYQDFIQQLAVESRFDKAICSQGITLLLQGLFKKIALSDNLALIANQGFNASSTAGSAESWLAALAFTFQIYFDFSGYTDMGRGSAMMLGYKLPDNFNFPYLAKSMTDFWKRWHISLSSWLRDYLYIPLGGGRCSSLRKNFNLLVTMLLGGLWHGAAWHFVAWGGLHGSLLIANHRYDDFVKGQPVLQKFHAGLLGKGLSLLLTFVLVVISWVLFRAETVSQAMQMLEVMFLEFKPSADISALSSSGPLVVALSAYLLYAVLAYLNTQNPRFQFLSRRFVLAAPARAVVYAGVAFAAVGFAPAAPSPFIYFQF